MSNGIIDTLVLVAFIATMLVIDRRRTAAIDMVAIAVRLTSLAIILIVGSFLWQAITDKLWNLAFDQSLDQSIAIAAAYFVVKRATSIKPRVD